MEQGFKHLISTTAIGLVIFLFALGFWLYDKRRKRKERTLNDSRKLKSGKINLARLTPLLWDENLKTKIINWGQKNGARIIEGVDDSLIMYLNERGKSQFDGFLNISINSLPARVIFINKNNQLFLRIDEDWGFQMFVGPAAKAFKENYAKRLRLLFEEIETQFSK